MTQHITADVCAKLQRRAALAIAVAVCASTLLSGCGFKLRGRQSFAFASIAIAPNPGGELVQELRRALSPLVHVVAVDTSETPGQLVLDVYNEQREKVVVGVNSSGQVREFQLRLRLSLRARTHAGKDVFERIDISQQRDISFNETSVLAKEAEEALLYRDMQTDIVQQILRRLAKVQVQQLD